MALIITHATVAGNPQTPLLDDTDWNANHALSGSVAWGEITGTISAQTDLQTALNAKASLSGATFTGAISATNLSGTNTGDQTSVTGNAGTATALQTPRNINGVSFNGTADITVTADAGTLTGSTLAAGVTASSLTSVGTVATGTWQATPIADTYGGVPTGGATAQVLTKDSGSNYDASWQTPVYFTHPGYITDRYYPQFTGGVAVTTASVSVNRLYALPFYCGKTTTFTRIGIEVTTGAGGATDYARLGIYENNDGLPGNLLLDAGVTATLSTTGDKEITISQQLVAGNWYFLSCLLSVGATLRSYASNGQVQGFFGKMDGANNAGALRIVQSYGALPNPFGTVSNSNFENISAPIVWLRKV